MAAELNQIYHAVQHEHSYRLLHCEIQLNVLHLMKKHPKTSCGYTKSVVIVTEVLAPTSEEEIINMLNLNILEECHCVV